MPFTFNGTGTTYYGQRDIAPDGSYVTTRWFCILWVPIIPLDSWRVLPVEGKRFTVLPEQRYVAQKLPLCWAQVKKTYFIAAAIVASLVIIGVMLEWTG
jgi:hypothetical protein